MKKDITAGIDSSTQSCTIVLRDLNDGSIIAESRIKHPKTTPPCSEQKPEDWLEALILAFKNLKEYLSRIACISVGGQGHGLVILDENYNSLRKAKLWNDTESFKEANYLRKLINDNYWEAHIGSIPAPALTISKLLWMENNYHDVIKRSSYIMLPSDYIVFMLTGNNMTERGVASGTGYFNPYDNIYDEFILDKSLSSKIVDKLPKIVNSNGIAGKVKKIKGIEELEGALVSVGTGDNMAAAIGLNCKENDIVISIGTSGTLYSITTKKITNTCNGMVNLYADATNRYMPMLTTLNAAKVTDTFRNILNCSTNEFDDMVINDKDYGRDLILIPYLDGERSPNLPFALGTLNGIKSDVKRQHIASASVIGVVCNLLEGINVLKTIGLKLDGKIILTGGGSNSLAYRQIISDFSKKEVYICNYLETAAAGAALLAASVYKKINIEYLMESWNLGLEKAASPRNNIDTKKIIDSYNYYQKKYKECIYEEN